MGIEMTIEGKQPSAQQIVRDAMNLGEFGDLEHNARVERLALQIERAQDALYDILKDDTLLDHVKAAYISAYNELGGRLEALQKKSPLSFQERRINPLESKPYRAMFGSGVVSENKNGEVAYVYS
jgi:hypothetical protein